MRKGDYRNNDRTIEKVQKKRGNLGMGIFEEVEGDEMRKEK